jgi:hypothetical protein
VMLGDPDTCPSPVATVDVRGFGAGGEVAVTVTCRVGQRGLEPIAPPARSFTVTAFAAVDPFRAMAG